MEKIERRKGLCEYIHKNQRQTPKAIFFSADNQDLNNRLIAQLHFKGYLLLLHIILLYLILPEKVLSR